MIVARDLPTALEKACQRQTVTKHHRCNRAGVTHCANAAVAAIGAVAVHDDDVAWDERSAIKSARRLRGWAIVGECEDCREALEFAAQHGVLGGM